MNKQALDKQSMIQVIIDEARRQGVLDGVFYPAEGVYHDRPISAILDAPLDLEKLADAILKQVAK